mgnify:CR=1 FL=1|jgi:hypothetical protein
MDKIGLTPEEAAKLVPVSEHAIREVAHTDPTFPAFIWGRGMVIPLREFQDWLAQKARLRVGFPEHVKRAGRR